MLISRAHDRVLVGYSERHHVIPRCMGGGNENTNIVRLTPEEHYVAHQLLVKLNPGNHKLVWAAWGMTVNWTGDRANNKAFGWLRRRASEVLRGNSHHLGKRASLETRGKLSAALKGNKNSLGKGMGNARALGKKHIRSPEYCAVLSAALTGLKRSPEHCANISKAKRGTKQSIEARAKRSASHKARIERMRALGIPHEMTGRKLSEEARANMAKAQTGRKHSAETRAKMCVAQQMVAKKRAEAASCQV